jgi:hypothetical protein
VRLVGFITKKFAVMHGHINVKYNDMCVQKEIRVNNNIYYLQLGWYPVAVVILHV